MIDLSKAVEGKLGEDTWFSDIFFAAAKMRFSGGVLVHGDESGVRTVFFRNGAPVHAGGAGFTQHYLGEILVKQGHCDRQAVADALEQQQGMTTSTPLLGTLLVANAGVSPDDIKHAVQVQIAARIGTVMALDSGTFQAAAGEDERIRSIGVRTDAWRVFVSALTEFASASELRAMSDALLGHAVSVDLRRIPGDFNANEEEDRILKYLKKPRKPDQLERATGNRRMVRGLLRALTLFHALERVPAAKGIPIPKGTIRLGHGAYTGELPAPEKKETVAPRRSSSVSKRPIVNRHHPVVKEVNELHATMGKKNHFELLGASSKTDAATLRQLFTTLAKKYHPDAFPIDVPEEAKVKAREITAALNEAYQTLTDETDRAHYEALLADDRIKGDARRAELIREAEVKAQMGAVMMKKREYQKAREFFKFAMEVDPTSGEYKAHFAWAVFVDPASVPKEAIETAYPLIVEALQLKQGSAMIHYYAGRILKAKEQPTEAMFHFKEALRADRKHMEAQRELRLLKLRAERSGGGDDDKKGGALSRLFKRS